MAQLPPAPPPAGVRFHQWGDGPLEFSYSSPIIMQMQPLNSPDRLSERSTLQSEETLPIPSRASGFSWAGLALALPGALLALASGPGCRLGFWELHTGMMLLRAGTYTAMAAALLSFVGILGSRNDHTRGRVTGTAGLLIALIIISYPGSLLRAARKSPLHDLSTDMAHPPEFGRRLAPLGPPAPAAGGRATASLQHQVYPDIQPLLLHLPPATAFRMVLAIAHQEGWQVIAADAQAGRLEATDTTFWFGVVDEIAVRLTAVPGGTRVDIRSAARGAGSDLGTNARRIRGYLHALSTAAQPLPQ
jgi:uncharacterized protein (DUF1499 family)